MMKKYWPVVVCFIVLVLAFGPVTCTFLDRGQNPTGPSDLSPSASLFSNFYTGRSISDNYELLRDDTQVKVNIPDTGEFAIYFYTLLGSFVVDVYLTEPSLATLYMHRGDELQIIIPFKIAETLPAGTPVGVSLYTAQIRAVPSADADAVSIPDLLREVTTPPGTSINVQDWIDGPGVTMDSNVKLEVVDEIHVTGYGSVPIMLADQTQHVGNVTVPDFLTEVTESAKRQSGQLVTETRICVDYIPNPNGCGTPRCDEWCYRHDFECIERYRGRVYSQVRDLVNIAEVK